MNKRSRPPIHRNLPALPPLATLAAEALAFLAADEERLDRFFVVTGLAPDDLRRVSRQAGFAESLLDHLASDDRLFLAFAEANGHDPQRLEAFRASLAAPDGDP